MGPIVWVLVVVFLICAVIGMPSVGVFNHGYGYAPSGIFGIIVVVLVILLLMGRL